MPAIEQAGTHRSRLDKPRRCLMCDQVKSAEHFYISRYTTAQGKESKRLETRCKPCARAKRKATYHRDPAAAQEIALRWRSANRDKVLARNKVRQADPEHRALKAHHQRLRKARLRSGQGDTPSIRAIYALAAREEALIQRCPLFDLPELGKKLHVDHRIPLARGGLHEIGNLQILPIGINMRKGASCPR